MQGSYTFSFTSTSEKVRVAVEAERLAQAYKVNPAFASEISRIDPLPHQRIAVYDHMLKQYPLRFLLADDAGAGKTIMCGLYIREMLARKRIRRILIVPPAGLVGNWKNELFTLFQLEAVIVTGAMIRDNSVNPFTEHDLAICSIDTIRTPQAMKCLGEGTPYDLSVFDEAHKLTCDRFGDSKIKESERYKTASAIAGADFHKPQSERLLPWHTTHVLLLTATPHMGKDYPYFALWRILEPQLFPTIRAFEEADPDLKAAHFIRRTKEEMVTLQGTPLYPMRCSSTLSYILSDDERQLYDATTDYLRYIYNKAENSNRSASQLALSVFQRRLASSSWALLRSMERRIEKINDLIKKIEDNSISEDILIQSNLTAKITEPFSSPTDEEEYSGENEKDEKYEDVVLGSMVARNLKDLYYEKENVKVLIEKARQVYDNGCESKFEKLREVIELPEYKEEKLLIFTEHKDTLEFLTNKLEALGYVGRIAFIHGGLGFEERQEQIAFFRKPDGARIMLCTDAAAEGVNLQFCWIMFNYDIPWNPARLEQRMGRIHRYGQKHNPVFLLNLVASDTREGKVLTTLLGKLEAIRKHLNSDKVFDSIGRVFSEVSISDWMRRAMLAVEVGENLDAVGNELDGVLTEEQIRAISEKEESIYGTGGDVKIELPRLHKDLDNEYLLRVLPGYMHTWIASAAPLLGLMIVGDLNSTFQLRSVPRIKIDHSSLWDAINNQTKENDPKLSLHRDELNAIWVHPGEPVFEALRRLTWDILHTDALAGAVFQDYETTEPYILYAVRFYIQRHRNDKDEILDERLVCLQNFGNNNIKKCGLEKFLVINDAEDISYTSSACRLAASQGIMQKDFNTYLHKIVNGLVESTRKREQKELSERKRRIQRVLDSEASKLAAQISILRKQIKQNESDIALKESMAEARQRLLEIGEQRTSLLDFIESDIENIISGDIESLGYALVIPANTQESSKYAAISLNTPIENIAMEVAIAWERKFSDVMPVHTPELARSAHLNDYPGFDLLAYEHGTKKRKCIEVKGTGRNGQVWMTQNELARAAILRDEYWLYVVYDCATTNPHLVRLQNPFEHLIIRSYINTITRLGITMQQIVTAGKNEHV